MTQVLFDILIAHDPVLGFVIIMLIIAVIAVWKRNQRLVGSGE